MKVLIVFNHPAPYKVNLFNLLSKEIDLDVIFERKRARNREEDFYKNNTYDFHHFFLKKGAFGDENSNTVELVKYLKENHQQYDLIVMNGYSTFSEMRAIKYLNKNKIPFCLYINGGVIKKDNPIKKKIKTYFISSASSYLSPSKEADDYLIHYGAHKEDIFRYNYSTIFQNQIINEQLNNREKDALRNQLGLPSGKLLISASQFIERKNILFLLECFKNLNEKLILIGSGPLKETYETYIKENNLSNVIILDYMPTNKLLTHFKAGDAFITLSKEDIYGHTINEAFSQGLPVISSKNVTSAHKLIKDGINGYIVDLDKKEDIIDKIKTIDYSMGVSALKVAKENTIEKMAKQHIEIFKKLAK